MKPTKQSFIPCPKCELYIEADLSICPFCDAQLKLPKRSSLAARFGIAAALSMFGVTSVVACAYGMPPVDCLKDGCSSGYTCNKETKQCDPVSTEKLIRDGGPQD